MLQRLLLQFIKSNGRKPNNLEMILLRQKASKEAVNERKIVNMFDRQPVDANKPILGGKNIIETEEQILQRLNKQNQDSINRIQDNKEFGKALKEALMKTDNPFSDLVKTTKKGPKSLQQRRLEAEEALRNKNVVPIKDPPKDMAGGGVAGLLGESPRQNFKMGKRAFLKLMGGVGAGIAGLKSGLLGLGGKQATKKAVTETVKQTAGSGAPPPYFINLVKKIKNLGDDVTETSAIADRQKVTKFKDYEMTEDISTGNIEILKKERGGFREDVYMSYKVDDVPLRGKKKSTKVEEYEEYTARPDQDGKMRDVEPGVPDEVVQEGTVFEDTLSEFGKADGGRIGYSAGSKVIGKGIMAGINKLFGKGTMTTADKIKRPQQALDREMFKKFETNNPKLSEVDQDLLIRGKELDLDPEMMKTTYKSFIEDKGGIGSLREFHADFVKQTGKNIPIDNLRQAWRLKRTYPFNTPVVDKTGKYIGGEATQKMYPESKKFLVEESAESFMKPKVKKTTEREFIDVPPMPKGFKLSREKLEKNYPELDEDMIDQIMELDKDMQGTVLTMLKNRRKDPDAYDKLLKTKGDTLEFQGAFDKVTRRKNNATGGLAAMLGE